MNELNFLKRFFRYRFNLDEDKAEEAHIIESIDRGVEFKGTNLWALIFAIFIASIGLNVNSTAVIIGAMLISPLMGPIMGIGMGIGIFDFDLVTKAVKNLVIAVLIGLATSTLYFLLTPLDEARSELLARTTPTIWDVLIALFGGLAGIIAGTRRNISNAIPGVAIATALMPPLCTAGYGLANAQWSYFFGAFYLFLINCVFISISTFVIVKFLKFRPKQFVDAQRERRVRKTIWIIAVVTILPSIYLAYQFVQQEFFGRRVKEYISQEIKARNIYVIDKVVNASSKEVYLVIFGDSLNEGLSKNIIANRLNYGLGGAKISIRQTLNITDRSKNTEELTGNLQKHLLDNDRRLNEMFAVLSKRPLNAAVDSSVYREFYALFGKPDEISISQAAVLNEQDRIDTMLLFYYRPTRRSGKFDDHKIEAWLKERTKISKVRIVK